MSDNINDKTIEGSDEDEQSQSVRSKDESDDTLTSEPETTRYFTSRQARWQQAYNFGENLDRTGRRARREKLKTVNQHTQESNAFLQQNLIPPNLRPPGNTSNFDFSIFSTVGKATSEQPDLSVFKPNYDKQQSLLEKTTREKIQEFRESTLLNLNDSTSSEPTTSRADIIRNIHYLEDQDIIQEKRLKETQENQEFFEELELSIIEGANPDDVSATLKKKIVHPEEPLRVIKGVIPIHELLPNTNPLNTLTSHGLQKLDASGLLSNLESTRLTDRKNSKGHTSLVNTPGRKPKSIFIDPSTWVQDFLEPKEPEDNIVTRKLELRKKQEEKSDLTSTLATIQEKETLIKPIAAKDLSTALERIAKEELSPIQQPVVPQPTGVGQKILPKKIYNVLNKFTPSSKKQSTMDIESSSSQEQSKAPKWNYDKDHYDGSVTKNDIRIPVPGILAFDGDDLKVVAQACRKICFEEKNTPQDRIKQKRDYAWTKIKHLAVELDNNTKQSDDVDKKFVFLQRVQKYILMELALTLQYRVLGSLEKYDHSEWTDDIKNRLELYETVSVTIQQESDDLESRGYYEAIFGLTLDWNIKDATERPKAIPTKFRVPPIEDTQQGYAGGASFSHPPKADQEQAALYTNASYAIANAMKDLKDMQIDRGQKHDLPKFSGGGARKWLIFWHQFQVLIDKNQKMTVLAKYSKLRDSLEGPALKSVTKLLFVENTYELAKKILIEEFGNPMELASDLTSDITRSPKLVNATAKQYRELANVLTQAKQYMDYYVPHELKRNVKYIMGDLLRKLPESERKDWHTFRAMTLLQLERQPGVTQEKIRQFHDEAVYTFIEWFEELTRLKEQDYLAIRGYESWHKQENKSSTPKFFKAKKSKSSGSKDKAFSFNTQVSSKVNKPKDTGSKGSNDKQKGSSDSKKKKPEGRGTFNKGKPAGSKTLGKQWSPKLNASVTSSKKEVRSFPPKKQDHTSEKTVCNLVVKKLPICHNCYGGHEAEKCNLPSACLKDNCTQKHTTSMHNVMAAVKQKHEIK